MVDLRSYQKLIAVEIIRDLVRKWWGVDLGLANGQGEILEGTGALTNGLGDVLKTACQELKVHPASRKAEIYPYHADTVLVVFPILLGGSFSGCVFATAQAQSQNGTPALEKLSDLLALVASQVAEVYEQAVRRERALTRPPEFARRYRFDEIIGGSPPIQEMLRLLEKIVESEATVLIQGESGTGKELVARAIHYNGLRARKPFVVQNCSAFNDNLLESVLFGHVKGSFTGAVRDKKGLFEVADGGTFFLDEIGDMSQALQTKLLRVLEEGTFTPVGSNETKRVDVRLIAATHKDLQAMVERREFREDLYYRVHVIRVVVPALRVRLEDLPLLVEHFLRKHQRAKGVTPRLDSAVLACLGSYPWPGNIRELENEIERLIVLGGENDVLGADLLSPRIAQAGNGRLAHVRGYAARGTLREATEALERDMIQEGLTRTSGNRSQLAKSLGMSRSNLILKIERYGLDRANRSC